MSEEDIESPYCEVCGTCGYIGCCGIRNFIAEHIEGKTNCKNEDIIINELINLCDYRDEVFEKNKKLQTILRTRARQDRKRKAKLRKLRLETTNQRLKLERLHSIIKEVREWVVEHSFSNGISSSTFFMPNSYANELLQLLDKENK